MAKRRSGRGVGGTKSGGNRAGERPLEGGREADGGARASKDDVARGAEAGDTGRESSTIVDQGAARPKAEADRTTGLAPRRDDLRHE
jgi:hypothetical protein